MRINLKSLIIIVIFILVILESFFSVPFLQYVDEVLGIISFVYLIIYFVRCKKIQKGITRLLCLLGLIVIIGFGSNLLFNIQYNWSDVIMDLFQFIKPYCVFFALYLCLNGKRDMDNLINKLLYIVRILSYIIFIFWGYSLIFDTPYAVYDEWAMFPGFKTFLYFVKYPSILAVYISVLIAFLAVKIDDKRNMRCIILNLVSIFFTQSGIALIAIFLFVVLQFVFRYANKIRWYHIVLLVIGGIFVGFNEISSYLLNENATRSVMLMYSVKTANNYFPLGSGFSTYGGAMAQNAYSKLYLEYGFQNRWGMGKGDLGFQLHDSYFPMILAQFGYIGFVLLAFFYAALLKMINTSKLKNTKISMLYIFFIVLVANMGQGGFGSIAGVLLMMGLAIISKYE